MTEQSTHFQTIEIKSDPMRVIQMREFLKKTGHYGYNFMDYHGNLMSLGDSERTRLHKKNDEIFSRGGVLFFEDGKVAGLYVFTPYSLMGFPNPWLSSYRRPRSNLVHVSQAIYIGSLGFQTYIRESAKVLVDSKRFAFPMIMTATSPKKSAGQKLQKICGFERIESVSNENIQVGAVRLETPDDLWKNAFAFFERRKRLAVVAGADLHDAH